jgi:hypothetical protein
MVSLFGAFHVIKILKLDETIIILSGLFNLHNVIHATIYLVPRSLWGLLYMNATFAGL